MGAPLPFCSKNPYIKNVGFDYGNKHGRGIGVLDPGAVPGGSTIFRGSEIWYVLLFPAPAYWPHAMKPKASPLKGSDYCPRFLNLHKNEEKRA